MISVTTPLRRAGELLDTPEGCPPSRGALAAAFRYVWEATVWKTDWSPELRDRADDLYDLMFAYGPMHRTAAAMSDEEIVAAVRAVHAFITRVEAAVAVPVEVRRRAERYVGPARQVLGVKSRGRG